MNVTTLFALHLIVYAGFPFYATRLKSSLRATTFFVYISILLTLGGFVGSVYSFPITDSIRISGGNLLYGALMMTSILFVIIERDVDVLRQIIRLVITVNVFKFLVFTIYSRTLESPEILNPFETASGVFSSSVFFLIVGGLLIIFELFLLLLIFERLKKRIANIFILSIAYTFFFVLVLCLDGVLFPAIAFSFNPNLTAIVVGNVQGKFIMAVAYSLPIFLFLLVYRQQLIEYVETPLKFRELLTAHKDELIAEIQRQEQEIEQGEARYHRLTENARDMIYRMSLPDGKYEYVNPASINLLGYSPQDLYLYPELSQKIIHPDWKDFFNDLWANLVAGESASSYEYQIVHKSGEVKWVYQRNALVKDEEGRPIATEGILTDITERVLAENALQRSEEKYRQLVELAQEGIWVIDKEANTTFVNPSMAHMLGYTVDEMNGRHLFSFMDEHGQQIAAHNLEQREKGVSEQHDFEFIRKDGARIYTTIETAPINDEDGKYRGAIAGVIDITERVRATEELLKERATLQTIIDNIPVLLTRYDPGANMLYLNKEFETVVGWTTEEAKKIDLMEKVYPDPDYRKQALAYMQEASVNWREFKVQCKSGAFIDSEWSNVLLEDGTQIGIGIDITERKLAQEALRQYAQHLETLQRVTAVLTASLSLEKVLDQILEQLAIVVPYDSATIFLYEQEHLRGVAAKGYAHPEKIINQTFPSDDGYFLQLLDRKEPLYVSDAQADPQFDPWGDNQHIRGWMTVPMLIDESILGYLSIDSVQVGAYGPDEAAVAAPFANQAAQAIENARLHEQVRRHADELEERVRDRTEKLNMLVNAMTGREVRMAELKKVIKKLRKQLQDAGMNPVADDPLLGS